MIPRRKVCFITFTMIPSLNIFDLVFCRKCLEQFNILYFSAIEKWQILGKEYTIYKFSLFRLSNFLNNFYLTILYYLKNHLTSSESNSFIFLAVIFVVKLSLSLHQWLYIKDYIPENAHMFVKCVVKRLFLSQRWCRMPKNMYKFQIIECFFLCTTIYVFSRLLIFLYIFLIKRIFS